MAWRIDLLVTERAREVDAGGRRAAICEET
jgi:hypothetical protein